MFWPALLSEGVEAERRREMPKKGVCGSYVQATRVLKLLNRLRGQRFHIKRELLCADLGVSDRQLCRDLLMLEEAGYMLDQPPRQKTVRLTQASTRGVAITTGERFALLAVLGCMEPYRGTSIYDDIMSLTDKVVQSLPKPERDEFYSFGERLLCLPDGGRKDYSSKTDVIEEFRKAVFTRRVVRYEYTHSDGTEESGYMAPYSILTWRNGFYVAGCAFDTLPSANEPPKEERPYFYALERFSEVKTMVRSKVVVPEGLCLRDLVNRSFGLSTNRDEEVRQVVVDFDAECAQHVIARDWHTTQLLEPLACGGVRMTIEVVGLRELKTWIMSWGARALVQEPVSLADEIHEELGRAVARYLASRPVEQSQRKKTSQENFISSLSVEMDRQGGCHGTDNHSRQPQPQLS